MKDKPDNMNRQIARHGIFIKSREQYNLRVEADWLYFDFFRLLQISPSYWHEHLRRRSPQLEQVESPPEAVRNTYERFGPVWELPFWTWWLEKAQFQFGSSYTPQVNLLGVTQEEQKVGTSDARALGDSVKDYFGQDFLAQGLPATALLAVPLKGSRKDILSQVNRILDEQWKLGTLLETTSPFKMQKNNIRRETVRMAIRVTHARAAFHDRPLYVAGKRAGIKGYDVDEAVTRGYDDDRRELSMITSRHLLRGYHLAEQAARGKFPSMDAPPTNANWPSIDYAELGPRLDLYARVSQAALDRIPLDERTSEWRYAGRNRTIKYETNQLSSKSDDER